MSDSCSRDFIFLPLDRQDLEEVAEAENICFTDPWSAQALEYLLPGQAMFSLISREKESGKLAAYAGLGYVLDEGEIVNIAVLPEFRRRGLGRTMLGCLFDFCREKGINSVYLEVRESNTAARALYSAQGFRECGRRKKYYTNPAEDAVLMVTDPGLRSE